MKGYSALALYTVLMQAQTSPDNSIPCDYWPPGAWNNPCLPPDPHPFLHFSVTFCFFTAMALLLAYLRGAFQHESAVTLTEEEARQLSGRISDALSSVQGLRGAALRKHCKVIVRGLLVGVDFSLQSVREYYADHEPEEELVLECMAAILRSGRRLRLYLDRTRDMLRFWPLVSPASRRTLEAVRQYEELVDLIRRCNSKLPDSANALPILELKPAE